MKTRILKALFIILLLAAIPIAAGAAEITDVSITIAEPKAGEHPSFSISGYEGQAWITHTGYGTSSGYISGKRWTDQTSGDTLDENSVFISGHIYKLEIALTVRSTDDRFSNFGVTVTVNGRAVSNQRYLDSGTNNHQVMLVTVYFYPGSIEEVTVTGMKFPHSGETPVFSLSVPAGSEYGIRDVTRSYVNEKNEYLDFYNGVCWYDATDEVSLRPSDEFIGGHLYRLRVELEAGPENLFVNDEYKPTITASTLWTETGISSPFHTNTSVYCVHTGDENTLKGGDWAKYAGVQCNLYGACRLSYETYGGTECPDRYVHFNLNPTKPKVDPTKEGLHFGGWYYDEDFQDAYNFSRFVTQDTTFYAKWTGTVECHSYDRDDPENGLDSQGGFYRNGVYSAWSLAAENYTYGETISLRFSPGYEWTFVGWYDMDTGELISESAEFEYTFTHDVRLRADSVHRMSTFHFDSRGGSPVPDQMVWWHKEKPVEPEPPTKEGYTFGGWYTTNYDGTLEQEYDFSWTVWDNEMTLAAKWDAAIDIKSYDLTTGTEAYGGKVSADGCEPNIHLSGIYDLGTELFLEAFSADTYRFVGWRTEGSAEYLSSSPTWTLTADKNGNYFADFEKIPISSASAELEEKEEAAVRAGMPLRTGDTRYAAEITAVSCGGESLTETLLLPRRTYTLNIRFSSDIPFDSAVTVTVNGKTAAAKDFTADRKSFSAEYAFTMPPSAVVYHVSFDPGDGSGSMAPAQVHKYDSLTAPECAFTAPGKMVFDAWLVSPDRTRLEVGEAYTPAGDCVLIAQWKDASRVPIEGMLSAKVTLPVIGETVPDGTKSASPVDPEKYAVRAVYQDLRFTSYEMKPTDRFEAGGEYLVIVEFTALDGFSVPDGIRAEFNGTEAEFHERLSDQAVLFSLKVSLRLAGDADGNRVIEAKDALRVLQYLKGQKVDIRMDNADVNGDKKVDMEDARLILQSCAGWFVTLK